MSTSKPIQQTDWINFFSLSIIWGFSFFFIKKGLEVYSALQVAAFRMSIAFVALLPFIIYNFRKLKIPARKWRYIPFALFLGAMFFGVQLTGKKIIGVLIGFIGASLIIWSKINGL